MTSAAGRKFEKRASMKSVVFTDDIDKSYDVTQHAHGAEGSGGISRAMVEHMSPATRLLEKRRQMFEVQELLEAKKAEYEEKEAGFKAREDALRKNDAELQEQLIKFSKFLQENEGKRARALRKAADSQKVAAAKAAEAAELQAQLAEREATCSAMKDTLARHLKYQTYLESVVDALREGGETGAEVGDLLRRHATLSAIQGDLREQQRAAEQELGAVEAESAAFVRAKGDELLGLRNEISLLKQGLEAVRAEAAGWAARKDASIAVAAQRALEHGQVHMSIANIYRRVLAHSCVAHREGLSPEEQLAVVGHFVSDLGHVLRAVEGREQRGAGTAADK